jgi:hypothetical protein
MFPVIYARDYFKQQDIKNLLCNINKNTSYILLYRLIPLKSNKALQPNITHNTYLTYTIRMAMSWKFGLPV